jgi:hypothetical protein
VYVVNKFGAPISTWAHSHSSEDQITVLTPTSQDPEFFFVKYMMPFKQLEKEIPGLKLKYEPYYKNILREQLGYYEIINTVQQPNSSLPQFIYVNVIPVTFDWGITDFVFNDFEHHFLSSLLASGCYDIINQTTIAYFISF